MWPTFDRFERFCCHSQSLAICMVMPFALPAQKRHCFHWCSIESLMWHYPFSLAKSSLSFHCQAPAAFPVGIMTFSSQTLLVFWAKVGEHIFDRPIYFIVTECHLKQDWKCFARDFKIQSCRPKIHLEWLFPRKGTLFCGPHVNLEALFSWTKIITIQRFFRWWCVQCSI